MVVLILNLLTLVFALEMDNVLEVIIALVLKIIMDHHVHNIVMKTSCVLLMVHA